jgi:hypothetical protein
LFFLKELKMVDDEDLNWKSGLEQALDRFEEEKDKLDESIESVTRYRDAQENLLMYLAKATKATRQIQITLSSCTTKQARHLIMTEAELVAMDTSELIH